MVKVLGGCISDVSGQTGPCCRSICLCIWYYFVNFHNVGLEVTFHCDVDS